MENVNVRNKNDLILFEQMLGDNISMLFGDRDEMVNDLFSEKVKSKIDSLEIHDWAYKDDVINENVHGNTTFSDNGHTNIKMYGLTGYTKDIKYLEMVFSHELWHALMVVFNDTYGKYFKRNVFIDANVWDVTNYSGFLKCDTEGFSYTPGYYMADSLAQILALAVVRKRNEAEFIIDDVFKNRIDSPLLNSPEDDLLTFFQMFVASFNLSTKTWMNRNFMGNRGILESTTINERSNILPNNIFISESIRNPLAVMDEFDKYEGKGAYVVLQSRIDTLYRKYLNDGVLDTKGFIGVSKDIKDFVNRRLYDYLDRNLISSNEYQELLSEFRSIYDEFMKEIKVYKVAYAKRKFKKRVKNLVNKRIK